MVSRERGIQAGLMASEPPSLNSGIGAVAPAKDPQGCAAPLDKNGELLLNVPGLHNFWDGKKWVVSHERFQTVADCANVVLPPPSPLKEADLFATVRSYQSHRLQKHKGASSSLVKDSACSTGEILEMLGDQLLSRIGCNVDELYAGHEDYGNQLPSYGGPFEVQAVRIEAPRELNICRFAVGANLAQLAKSSTRDKERTLTDKVAQRTIASELAWTGLQQPCFLDAREISPPKLCVEFSQCDLSGFPLKTIREASPGARRIWVFEDTQQGFAVVHDGERRFVASSNPIVMRLVDRLGLAVPTGIGESRANFDSKLQVLINLLQGMRSFCVVLACSEPTEKSSDEQLAADALQILSHPNPIFIKSSRSAGGKLVLRSRKDSAGAPIIESDSSEVGEILSHYVRKANQAAQGLSATNVQTRCFAEAAAQSVKRRGSVQAFLKQALESMEAPIVEGEIPVTRYRTTIGEEKAEFRMIMQGDDELKLVAHYAKASVNDIAANISLGGRGRTTQQVVRGIFQQQLAGRVSQEDINRRAGESLRNLTDMAETFAREFAHRVGESRAARTLNDFAVDICPVWDAKAMDLRYVLLEVQYGYAFEGLKGVSPSKANVVQNFKDEVKRRTEELARKRDKHAREQTQTFADILANLRRILSDPKESG